MLYNLECLKNKSRSLLVHFCTNYLSLHINHFPGYSRDGLDFPQLHIKSLRTIKNKHKDGIGNYENRASAGFGFAVEFCV